MNFLITTKTSTNISLDIPDSCWCNFEIDKKIKNIIRLVWVWYKSSKLNYRKKKV